VIGFTPGADFRLNLPAPALLAALPHTAILASPSIGQKAGGTDRIP
jgi:hypothetical protein